MFHGQDRCPGFEDTETCREWLAGSVQSAGSLISAILECPWFVPYHKAYQVAWAGSGTQACCDTANLCASLYPLISMIAFPECCGD